MKMSASNDLSKTFISLNLSKVKLLAERVQNYPCLCNKICKELKSKVTSLK